MKLIEGIRAGLTAVAPSPVPSSMLAPTLPAPELASPWVDRSALETLTIAAMYGSDFDPDNLPLTRAGAMAIPSVARSRTIICSTLGRLDLYLTNAQGVRATNELAAARMLAQPDPAQSRFLHLVWAADDCIFHGVSWQQVLTRYSEDNRPATWRRILPGGVELHDGGRVTVYGKDVDPADVFRIDGPHEGILNFATRSLRTAGKLEASAARFADNPVPAIELHQTDATYVPPEKRNELIAGWAAARRGANGGVAWTTHNVEARVHGAPAEHLLTSGRNAQAIDVARHIGVPADAIDASPEKASQNYANRADRLGVLVDYGLAAYGAAITARLSMPDLTPAGWVAAFDYDGITAVADSDPDTAPPKPATTPGAPE